MVRVLIAEGSPQTALQMQEILLRHGGIDVVGIVGNGSRLAQQVAELKPDVITMDMHMPGLDGIEVIQAIMEHTPTPIVVISSERDDASQHVNFRALSCGAVAVAGHPPAASHPDYAAIARSLADTVHAMAGVRVIRRRQRRPASAAEMEAPPAAEPKSAAKPRRAPRLLAIAASTGGPQALAQVLLELPADFRLPIVVVQHMSPGFVGGLVEWLDHHGCRLRCRVAQDRDPLLPGQILFAADGKHLEIEGEGAALVARLTDTPAMTRHLPSATPLFTSVAIACGDRAVGLIMTGMGADGVPGLKTLRDHGALTLAQSPDGCIVPSMPQSAIDAGAVDRVVPLGGLAPLLVSLQNPVDLP